MLEAMRRLGTATRTLHRGMKDAADTIGAFLVDAFHFMALFAIGATTVWSAAVAFFGMVAQGGATLGDILLLFIYLDILFVTGAVLLLSCAVLILRFGSHRFPSDNPTADLGEKASRAQSS
jgi:phosphate starvation-inducible membrane PsiE